MILARGPQTQLKATPGLRRHGDERTCPQVLRARHLLTMSAFYAKQNMSAREMEDGVSDHGTYEPGIAPINQFRFLFC